MSRRSTATVVAVLLFLTGAAALFSTVPFVRYSPGLTLNVLGEEGGSPIVAVSGHRTYPTTGKLRMTTVETTSPGRHLSLVEALAAWADPDRALYPYDAIYQNQSSQDVNTEDQIAMVSSQDNAVAAALTELGFNLRARPDVLRALPDGPSNGKLESHDILVSIDGRPVRQPGRVRELLAGHRPGDDVTVKVLRDGKPRSFTITTGPSSDDPRRAALGIFVGVGYAFPFQVSVRIPERIVGPSAGLIFSLAVYDTLTPGSLTGGADVAGTGTIDEKGRVGPIGGIRQKIAASQDAGAKLFLVPPDNCAEALAAHLNGSMKLVRVDTMHAALAAIKAYAADPDATLPACPQAAT